MVVQSVASCDTVSARTIHHTSRRSSPSAEAGMWQSREWNLQAWFQTYQRRADFPSVACMTEQRGCSQAGRQAGRQSIVFASCSVQEAAQWLEAGLLSDSRLAVGEREMGMKRYVGGEEGESSWRALPGCDLVWDPTAFTTTCPIHEGQDGRYSARREIAFACLWFLVLRLST